MLNLNTSLRSEFDPWDTNYARKYLQISEDQREKIDKIPGWSKTEISEKTATENEKTLENIEKQSAQQALISTEKIVTSTNISAEDNLKNNSDLQSKQNPLALLNEKELFLKNVSLSPLRKKPASAYSLQRSNSLPDLCKKLLFVEVLSHSNSEEIHDKPICSIEKDISSFKLAPQLTKSILNKTYTVPGVYNNCFDQNKLLEISNESFSCPLVIPNQLSKQKFKTLDDSILNHKYLKDIKTSVITSEAVPLFSNGTVPTTLSKEMSLFEKKLLLLEKRLSPSKEMSSLPFNSKLINLENSNCQKNLKSSQIPATTDEIVKAVVSSDSVEDLPDEIENSSVPKVYKSLKSQANSQSIDEKCDALKNTYKSAEDKTDDALKTGACNFESSLSPPLPCGQPVPKELPSQSIPSQKSTELNTLSTLLNAIPPVPCGQHLPAEVPPLSQPILSQKSAKLNTSSKSQNAALAGKIVVPEKSSVTFSVFSANLNEKVVDLASDKELGIKRKRKSKSEKSSKKLKRTDIQFSSAQIRNMIEIMKIFHTGS